MDFIDDDENVKSMRETPHIARTLVRRLISPLELYDASAPEWQMPDFIRADAEVKPGLLEGIVSNECLQQDGVPRHSHRRRIYGNGVPNGNRVTVWEVPIVGEMCRV
jgi:hypothetical protein